jgi:uncharacterized protein
MDQIKNWCKEHNYWPRKIVFSVLILMILSWFFCQYCGGISGHSSLPKDTITFSGKGELLVKPDIASVSFGVTAEDLDVSKAQAESVTKMNTIIDFLKDKGVKEEDIKTINYNIYPRYDYLRAEIYPYNGRQTLSAYVVSQTVSLKIRDIAKVGEILGGIGEYGATDVSGLTFTVDDYDGEMAKARDLAIKDAKEQAKKLSKSLGVKLVKIVSFSDISDQPYYYGVEKSMLGMGGDAVAPAPRIMTGENKITSNVSITYEIR